MIGTLFDTNIYGLMIERDDLELIKKLESDRREGKLIIHNFRIIRNELRKTKKILQLYDKLVCKSIHTANKQIENLVDLYSKKYEEKGGVQKRTQNFMNDLRIVAFASIKGLNIVFQMIQKLS